MKVPRPENPADRQELHISSMDCQYFPDLAEWFGGLKPQWAETHIAEDAASEKAGAPAGGDGEQPAANPDAPAADAAATEGGTAKAEDAATGPTGPGWVIELRGYHFHNEPRHKPLEAPNSCGPRSSKT